MRRAARGEQELDLERAGEGDELEVALAGPGECAGGGDGLAAQDGAAEADARTVVDERRRRRPSCRPSPWNLGGRFSRKALRPSRASGWASASIAASRSIASPSSSVVSKPSARQRLISRSPGAGISASRRGEGERLARASPPASRRPTSTRPISCASAAPSRSPRSSRRVAWARPTSRGSRCVPPPPGMIPSRISGQPISAGPLAHDAEVAGERELAAAAERVPGDLGDRPAAAAARPRPNVPWARSTRRAGLLGREVLVGERLELRPRHEDLLVRAREHDDPDRVVAARARSSRSAKSAWSSASSAFAGGLSSTQRATASWRSTVKKRGCGEIGIQTLVW